MMVGAIFDALQPRLCPLISDNWLISFSAMAWIESGKRSNPIGLTRWSPNTKAQGWKFKFTAFWSFFVCRIFAWWWNFPSLSARVERLVDLSAFVHSCHFSTSYWHWVQPQMPLVKVKYKHSLHFSTEQRWAYFAMHSENQYKKWNRGYF